MGLTIWSNTFVSLKQVTTHTANTSTGTMAALRLGLLTLALHVFANSPATLFRLSRLSCLSNPLGSPRCPPRAHRWAPRARGGDRGDGAREYKEWRRLPLQPYGVRTTLVQEVAGEGRRKGQTGWGGLGEWLAGRFTRLNSN
eukprot:1344767-Amorphochlora_amoeboformis.AAC.1